MQSRLEEKLFITHRTNRCPVPSMQIGGVSTDREGKQTPYLTYKRMTLHWSLINLEPDVILTSNNTQIVGKKVWGERGPRYILMEALSSINTLILGGWVNDLYMIGPHTPTKTSKLIAPIQEKDTLLELGFQGQLLTYDSEVMTAEEVFKTYNKNKFKHLFLQIIYPLTSNLERFYSCSNSAAEVADILLKNGTNNSAINKTFDAPKGKIGQASFQKTDSAYLITTNKRGLGLCEYFAIITDLFPTASHGQLSFNFFHENVLLEQLFPNSHWMYIRPAFSPFGSFEQAVEKGEFKQLPHFVSAIERRLNKESETYLRLSAFLDIWLDFYIARSKTEIKPNLCQHDVQQTVNSHLSNVLCFEDNDTHVPLEIKKSGDNDSAFGQPALTSVRNIAHNPAHSTQELMPLNKTNVHSSRSILFWKKVQNNRPILDKPKASEPCCAIS